MEKLNDKKKQRLDRLYNKYKPHENFIIAKSARKQLDILKEILLVFQILIKY